MDVPNNTKTEEIMDFKKFAQSKKGLIYHDEQVWIKGKFKEVDSKTVREGDNFWANKVNKNGESINAKTIYKAYLEWFNYTLRPGEKERIFVSAKMGENEDEY